MWSIQKVGAVDRGGRAGRKKNREGSWMDGSLARDMGRRRKERCRYNKTSEAGKMDGYVGGGLGMGARQGCNGQYSGMN